MKKTVIYLSIFAAALTMVSCGGGNTTPEGGESTTPEANNMEAAEVTYNIDGASSTIGWLGTMIGIKEHTGTVALNSGTLTTKDGMVQGGNFEVDMTSMVPTDENYQPEAGYSKEKLVGHLMSADFFAADSIPTATFEITGAQGSQVMGNLTVRGVTKPATVENVVVVEQDGNVSATGDLIFNRQDFGVSFSMGMQDMIISDDIVLSLDLSGAAAE